MSARETRVVTAEVVQMVEEYIRSELSDAEKYDNRTPLDESGIWSLHALSARIYARGFDDGERVEAERGRQARHRELAAAKSKRGAQ
jgi:hypothetical protein